MAAAPGAVGDLADQRGQAIWIRSRAVALASRITSSRSPRKASVVAPSAMRARRIASRAGSAAPAARASVSSSERYQVLCWCARAAAASPPASSSAAARTNPQPRKRASATHASCQSTAACRRWAGEPGARSRALTSDCRRSASRLARVASTRPALDVKCRYSAGLPTPAAPATASTPVVPMPRS